MEKGIDSFPYISAYSSKSVAPMLPKVAAIVVSHNSKATLERCIAALEAQDHCLESIILVDSGSSDKEYLDAFKRRKSVRLLLADNIGFSRANNLGYESLSPDADFVLFVNPDLFLPPDSIATALPLFEEKPLIAMLSGKLLGYDIEHDRPSGRIDSTGIQRKWYGRWFDRGQGQCDNGQYDEPEEMDALCGALLLCRNAALQSLPGPVFDPVFFLYKEDIELSLRLRKLGWKLLYTPVLCAYHCRGWKGERQKMSYALRVTAVKSELLLYKKHPSPYVLFALLKYVLVTVFRL
ncbi:putative glycosyltransferase [Desulfocapsa sulfexigens DSM 10523]|uniref:Putative glycosyltransferase n=2 Tax=Desulfocapsa TaxID=53318 RepID=M1NHE0_DESSD|nr:putative glycosyltransferase [Desulfocapsa sulfexigens DSM 10523]